MSSDFDEVGQRGSFSGQHVKAIVLSLEYISGHLSARHVLCTGPQKEPVDRGDDNLLYGAKRCNTLDDCPNFIDYNGI